MRNKKGLPVLVAEIKDELAKLEKFIHKLSGQKNRLEDEEIAESAALRLHNFYTGCERLFQLIAAEVNGFTPQTVDWHKRLLAQVALDIEGVRPAVISPATRQDLEELLKFRHIVRNTYGFELETERLENLVNLTLKMFPRFEDEINAFKTFLMDLYKNT